MKNIVKKLIYLLSHLQSEEKYARKVGVTFGKNCFFRTRKFGSEPFLISMGNDVHTASGVEFITHDGAVNVIRNMYEKYYDVDIFKKINIGNNVFIGRGARIMPGAKIENNIIIGAGSIVVGNLRSNAVYAGVPAKYICSIEEYVEKNEKYFSKTKYLSNANKNTFLHEKFVKNEN